MPILTRDEAAARSAAVPTAAYSIHLDFSAPGDSFRSTSTVTFDAAAGTDTFIDLVGTATRVTVNGEERDASALQTEDRISLTGLAGATTVVVEAECTYRTTGQGIHRFIDPETQETFLYSQFAIDDARGAFACFDQPDIKGTLAISVTAPDHWQVASNSIQPAPERVDGTVTVAGVERGLQRWDFSPTPLLPTYVAAVAAGPWAFEETTLTSKGGDVPARLYGRPQLADHFDAEEIFAAVQAGIELYERIFDTVYPYECYDQLFAPQYNLGAMENVGLVTISEDKLLFRTRPSQSIQESRLVTVLHELAHMWFGNLVTMQWWDDLWLNESFAEFVGTHAGERAQELDGAWTAFGAERKSVAYVQDQLPTTHPVLSDIPDIEAVAGQFDMITYAKGASALRQLALWLGEDTFFAGVARYLKAHAFGNATLADLFTELEAVSGRDLTAWSKAWLETAGLTALGADVTVADGAVTSLTVTEALPEPTAGAAPSIHHPHQLRVGAYVVHDGAVVPAWSVDVATDGASTPVAAAVGKPAPDLLLVNDGDLTYAKLRLDAVSARTAVEYAHALPPQAQVVTLGALWHMCRDGLLPAADYVSAVQRAVTSINNPQVRGSHLANAVTAIQRYAPVAQAQELAVTWADALVTLIGRAEPGSDAQLQLVRAFAGAAVTPGHAAQARAWLGGDAIPGLPLDSDLVWDLLGAVARVGELTDAEVDAQLAADPGSAGERRAAGVRALIGTPEAKQRAWNRLARPQGPLPANALAFEIGLGLSNCADPALLGTVVDDLLATLRPTYQVMDPMMGVRVAKYVMPVTLAGRVENLDGRLEQWLASNADAPGVLRKVVIEALDEVRRALAAQAARHGSSAD
ncbi:aminopeptidase N [Demequina sp. B12]|uniref:aminopeptidase N n=1 Tax=Demequina sp. B12 TaxID=2992757 RepID=UPI00237A729E|nr:aminopeptidase N [Demequina sp. B12]MDE0573523.1 aminopeptidase N [Demequina sp. B12]